MCKPLGRSTMGISKAINVLLEITLDAVKGCHRRSLATTAPRDSALIDAGSEKIDRFKQYRVRQASTCFPFAETSASWSNFTRSLRWSSLSFHARKTEAKIHRLPVIFDHHARSTYRAAPRGGTEQYETRDLTHCMENPR